MPWFLLCCAPLVVFVESKCFCLFAEALSAEVNAVAADVCAESSAVSAVALADAGLALFRCVMFDKFLFFYWICIKLLECFAIIFGSHCSSSPTFVPKVVRTYCCASIFVI